MRIISRKLKDAKTSTLSLQLKNALKNNYIDFEKIVSEVLNLKNNCFKTSN